MILNPVCDAELVFLLCVCVCVADLWERCRVHTQVLY